MFGLLWQAGSKELESVRSFMGISMLQATKRCFSHVSRQKHLHSGVDGLSNKIGYQLLLAEQEANDH